jgi:translocation and assembly module TamB
VRRGALILLVLLLALLGAGAFGVQRLLYTQAGLEFALRQLERLPAVQVETTGARGSLAGALSFDRVLVEHEAVRIDARGIRLVSQPLGMLAGALDLEDVAVERVEVRLKPRPPRPDQPLHFLPAWLRIEAPAFAIRNVALTLQNDTRVDVAEVTGDLRATRWRIDLERLVLRAAQGRVAGTLALRATQPLGVRSSLGGEWRFPEDEFEYRFRVSTSGRLDRLATEVRLDSPAQLSFVGTLLDLDEQPRARGTIRIVDVDGSPWLTAGTLPKVSGTIALAADDEALGVDGTLTSPALPDQPLRLRGGGRWEERAFAIHEMRAWLPRLGLDLTTAGRIELPAADAPQGTLPWLALQGGWTALRWPLDPAADPVVGSPSGRYTLEGTLPYAFTLQTEVAGPSMPRVAFAAAGAIDRPGLRLDRFNGEALGGRIEGRGTLQWSGEQAWSFQVAGRELSVAELRPGVDGRVSFSGRIEGRGLTADAPWTARLASLSGTMYGRPLTGRGEISHRAGIYELRDVRVANGTSFADLKGRVGPQLLDLAWDLDLRSLGIVLPGMAGQLTSRGTARGTPQRPLLAGTARARSFEYAGVRIVDLQADLDVDTTDRRASRIALDANEVSAGGLLFESVRAGLEGTMAEHAVILTLDSPGSEDGRIARFDALLNAGGRFDVARRAWSGDLTAASVDFADGEARLLQPAALELSAGAQRAAPICLRTSDDARLCFEGEHRSAPPAWRVIYSAQDWPVQRILNTLLGWREFDGRLQASGWAEKVPGREWVGGSSLLVHEPSLNMPRNKFRYERIPLGGARLDVFAEPEELRAALDLSVDETTRVEGEAVATRRARLADSPLRGRITGRSEAIKALPLIVPELDRAAGRLEGALQLGGTLGAPELEGEFRLRDAQLEFYRTNLVLRNVQADATFRGDTLAFTGRGETRKGALDVNGQFAWPGGVMTGSMRLRGEELLVSDTPEYRVVASPDLLLRAGADGYLVEGTVEIPMARISPRELTATVSTSPDERIVGIDVDELGRANEKPSTADRVTTRIRVVLGDSVRIASYGLKARLEGEVVVSSRPDDVVRGNGTIRVAEGEYRAFGQDVRITKGLLTFRDTPLGEPQLEIVAERRIKNEDIVIVVAVRGTLDQPFISITSTPAMSDAEALSFLLTGRSIDTLQSGEAASVNQAAESLALSGGGLLLGGLGSRLGLDELSLERTGEEDTSVVFGKFLSPKLFVSYGISIAEAINTVKLRYLLNERWSLKAEAGLEQSADVEYRIER